MTNLDKSKLTVLSALMFLTSSAKAEALQHGVGEAELYNLLGKDILRLTFGPGRKTSDFLSSCVTQGFLEKQSEEVPRYRFTEKGIDYLHHLCLVTITPTATV